MMRVIVVVLLALSTCTLAAESGTIKIGVIGPYSGGSSPMGSSMRNGVQLAAYEINWTGGLLGRQIELVERDDEANPERGAQIAQELIAKDKVVAAVGFINTGVALAAQKYFQEAKIPVINNVSAGAMNTRQFLPPKYPDNYIFRNSASDTIQAELVVREALERRGLRRVALFSDTTPYGVQGRALMKAALDKRGVEAVADETFKVGDTDMTAQLERARKARADILLCWGIGPELAAIANGRARLHWMVPMAGGWTLSLDNFVVAAGKNGNGARMPQTFIEEPTTSRHTTFILTYLNTYKSKRIASAVSAAQGYDSLLLLAAAIRQANSTEGEKVRAALEDLRERVSGAVSIYEHPFSKEDHEAITANMVVIGEVKNGNITYAYKDEERAAIVGRKEGR